jgi:hypothetical protein
VETPKAAVIAAQMAPGSIKASARRGNKLRVATRRHLRAHCKAACLGQ